MADFQETLIINQNGSFLIKENSYSYKRVQVDLASGEVKVLAEGNNIQFPEAINLIYDFEESHHSGVFSTAKFSKTGRYSKTVEY